MLARIRAASIARYGTYGSATKPLLYERGPNAGRAVEYVDIFEASDDGTVTTRRLTLDPAINGGRPEPGALVDIDAQVRSVAEVVYRRDGSERIAQRDRWRAVGFDVLDASGQFDAQAA